MARLHFESLRVVRALWYCWFSWYGLCYHSQQNGEKKTSTLFPSLRPLVLSVGYFSVLRSQIWNLFYRTHLNLSYYSSFSLLSFVFLSCLEGRKAVLRCKSSSFPPPQHQRWLEGEAHFPVSRVSQLTKNLGFPVRIRSSLTERRNFPPNARPVDGQGGVREGRRGRRESWLGPGNLHSSFLCRRQKREPVTVHEAGYRSTEVFSK